LAFSQVIGSLSLAVKAFLTVKLSPKLDLGVTIAKVFGQEEASMTTRFGNWLAGSSSARAIACTLPLTVVVAGLGLVWAHRGPTPETQAPVTEASAWQEPAQVGCGAISPSGDVDTTCALGVKWEYIGDAEATNNLGPRQMSYFRGSDGSMKVVSKAVDPNAEIPVQVGIQAPGEERFTRVTQRLSGGGMRLFDTFRYQPDGSYSMTVHDLSGREAWTRKVYDYKSDGHTVRRAVAYLRDGQINISPD
jgi:hypothetical protein